MYSDNVLIDLLEIDQKVKQTYHHQLIQYWVIEIYEENLIDINKHYLKQHNHNQQYNFHNTKIMKNILKNRLTRSFLLDLFEHEHVI